MIEYLLSPFRQWRLVSYLAKYEIKQKYAGSLAGALWMMFYPLITVGIYWFVFSYGFRIRGENDTPFIVYFTTGLVPWLMFTEVMTMSTTSVRANIRLIKKTVFPSEILPFVHIYTASVLHGIYLCILLIVNSLYGYFPTANAVGVVYYYLCLVLILTGTCWLLSAINVFFRDLGHAVPIILNIWFWLTPIVWSVDIVPEKYQYLINLNPIMYIVRGYREALIWDGSQEVFDVSTSGVFVLVTLTVLYTGSRVFRQLKREFADAA